jgi:hypothetical protein
MKNNIQILDKEESCDEINDEMNIGLAQKKSI